MAILSKQLLESLGVELTDEHLALLEEHFETTLDERVTAEIALELGDDQLEELEALSDAPDEQVQAWLAENVPDLKEIIEDETAILLGELAENSDQL